MAAFIANLRLMFSIGDAVLFESAESLVGASSTVIVGRLDDAAISAGRRVYSAEDDGEYLYSTVFIELQVIDVLKDDVDAPITESVIVEHILPPGLTVESLAASAPVGAELLVAGRDGTDLQNFYSPDQPTDVRLYAPFMQGLVVEDETGAVAPVTYPNEPVFADEDTAGMDQFAELVDFVEQVAD